MADDSASATTAAPTLAASVPELAWSADDTEDDPPVHPWRPVYRIALGVFTACVAVAGVITALDRHWFTDLRAELAEPPTVIQTTPPEPTHVAAPVTAPSFGPSAASLHTPEPPPVVMPQTSAADVEFLSRMRSSGWLITDGQQMLTVAHQACFDLRRGASREYVIGQLLATEPAIGVPGAITFYGNLVSAYDCTP